MTPRRFERTLHLAVQEVGWSTHLAVIEEKTHGGDHTSQSAATEQQREETGRRQIHQTTVTGRKVRVLQLPEVSAVDEEQAHHRAVQKEHAGDVEIRRVAQT